MAGITKQCCLFGDEVKLQHPHIQNRNIVVGFIRLEVRELITISNKSSFTNNALLSTILRFTPPNTNIQETNDNVGDDEDDDDEEYDDKSVNPIYV